MQRRSPRIGYVAAADSSPLTSSEDAKLLVLARATRARTGAPAGAALRDRDGRTYAAAAVDLPSLRLSAVGGCVAMAVSSGSTGAEAVVVLADELDRNDLDIVRDFAGPGVPVHLASVAGTVTSTSLT
jgi:hypothetical protein